MENEREIEGERKRQCASTAIALRERAIKSIAHTACACAAPVREGQKATYAYEMLSKMWRTEHRSFDLTVSSTCMHICIYAAR